MQSKDLDADELHALFKKKSSVDLARIYSLYSQRHGTSPGITTLSKVFERICEEEADVICRDVNKIIADGRKGVDKLSPVFLARELQNMKYVERFVHLHQVMREFVVNCFQSSFSFTNAMKNVS